MKSLGKDKLLKLAIGIIVAVVVIVIILLIYHSLIGKKNSYSDIENKVLKAAKKYYSENQNLLPQNDNEQISIDDVSLTSLGYLDNLSDMVENKEVKCSAKVIISYNNGNYRYTPILDCGEAYKSQTFASYIENNVERVYTGAGLYDLNGEYVYRGEFPNNYIKFSGHMYRIVKITDNKAVIILDDKYERVEWDDRYNTSKDSTIGINDYKVSRVKEFLDTVYNDNSLVDEKSKQLISKHNLYIGKRNPSDNYNDGSIEKAEVFENQYIGLLPLYDYINASIDTNCNSVVTNNCSNYNYLNHYYFNWWTITGSASNTYDVFCVYAEGVIKSVRAVITEAVRPVLYLADDALYVSGDGTKDNPYIVK